MRRLLSPLLFVATTTVLAPATALFTLLATMIFVPLPASLPKPNEGISAQISRVYDIDGNLIGSFRRFETTKPVAWADIPLLLRQAVVAVEDKRFYEHGGVDPRGLLRAFVADVRSSGVVQGGSTITQQYVKNAYVGHERSISRKLREAVLASQLDRQVDKDEILFRYLERIYLGEGAYGVGAASETYFRKPVNALTLSEVALLVGLIPAPSRYEPRGNPQLAELRRRGVLTRLLEQGVIDQVAHDEAAAQGIWLAAAGPPPPGQPVTLVYPAERQETAYPYFLDYVERYITARYGADAVYKQGYEIYTTLDTRMQAEADRSVQETLKGTEPPLEMALVAVEPLTGFVKALVGGRDFAASRVNLALGAEGGGGGRQPGSTWKPLVLASALEKGIPVDRRYSGANNYCTSGFCFQNYGKGSYGSVDLRTATRRSINTVFVQLLEEVGVAENMALANRLGVRTEAFDPKVHGLSVALGALDVSPIDMASAYGVFAARGERAEPTPIVRLLDGKGRLVEDNVAPARKRVLEERVADTMNDVLRHVFDSGSTASGKGLERPAAGKTGTTDNSGNAWFVGYTPTLSTAVWMGKTVNQQNMGPVKGVANVTGGTWPAKTWQAFMNAALADQEPTDFTEPAPVTKVADQAKREARQGFEVGRRLRPRPSDPGPGAASVDELPPLTAEVPSTTTSTTAPSVSTTPTTTRTTTPGSTTTTKLGSTTTTGPG